MRVYLHIYFFSYDDLNYKCISFFFLQDKIIQAEGSNSSLLGEVEALRKNLLKIQGKDEEVRKAEDLCRTVREKLEREENVTKELRAEIERLQRRMAELEKLEEAFGKSKSDCSQLCLSLNEEKNLTKKLSSELDALKARLKEMEGSETKLEKAEQALTMELEKLKTFTQAFVNERKRLLEKQREDEKAILKLTEKCELQKKRLGSSADPGHTEVIRPRIEDELSSKAFLTSKLAGRKKSLDYMKLTDDNMVLVNKSENEKNSSLEGCREEDNKVKELTQEIEKLKNRLKQLQIVEEDLKSSESRNGELHEKFQMERNRARQLSEQVDQLKMQLCGRGIGRNGTSLNKHGNGSTSICPNSPAKVLENGKAEGDEMIGKGFRQEKPRNRSSATFSEPSSPKYKNRDQSPTYRRESKLRSRELSYSEESSPKPARRALSPAHKSRRTPKSTAFTSDYGTRQGMDEKTRGAALSSGDIKKASVLSRYPPAVTDQKPLRTANKQADVEIRKSRVEKFSMLYRGSDSESSNSDVMADTSSLGGASALEKDVPFASDQESADQAQEPIPGSVSSTLSKANGSYTAYRSHVSPLLTIDQGSEGHSSASETESTGSRPSEPETVTEMAPTLSSRSASSKYSRYSHIHDSHSEDSSTRSSFDEELHSRAPVADGAHQGFSSSAIEIQRMYSPREALRSKAVIKPAIVEIDRKELMISEPLSTNGKPKISTKPVVTTTSKMTSSITFYPNDPSSSRTSSRSSSVSSEPLTVKERHTSTSNILIGRFTVLSCDETIYFYIFLPFFYFLIPGSNIEHHGSISVPYEISISKSEISSWPCPDQDCVVDDYNETASRTKPHTSSRVESATSQLCSQRSDFSLQCPYTSSVDFNDTESGFESSSSSTTTTKVTSWNCQRQTSHPHEDGLTDQKNATLRSTWKTGGVASGEDFAQGRGDTTRAVADSGFENDAENSTTWRAYRATTIDTEEMINRGKGPGKNLDAQKGARPSPAEVG